MIVEYIVIGFCFVSLVFLFGYLRKMWFMNPVAIFVLSQSVFFVGTLPLMQPDRHGDIAYVLAQFVFMSSFCTGALLAFEVAGLRRAHVQEWRARPVQMVENSPATNVYIWGIIIVSIVISIAYYYAIGYNVFLLSIAELLGSGSAAQGVSTLRLESYAGSRYFAPGYVNQFKNTLLPMLVAYIYVRSILMRKVGGRRRKGFEKLLSWSLVPLVLVFILGTGQRGAFVIAAAIVLVFINASLPVARVRKINIAATIAVLTIFIVSTVAIGRSGIRSFAQVDIGVAVSLVASRVFESNQLSGLVGFRYIYDLPVQWGSAWADSILGLLPGRSPGISISNEIFRILYGGTRGTAPLSLHGEVMYNWGWAGICIVPGIMGAVYAYIYVKLIRGRKSLHRLLCYAGSTFLLGVWVAGSPTVLANTGLVAIVILRYGVVFIQRYRSGVRPARFVTA